MTNRKPSEGKGRVKFNFVAQTPVSVLLADFAKTPAQPTGGSSMITNGSLRTATNYRSQPQYASLVH